MSSHRARALAPGAAVAFSLLAAFAAHHLAPPPSADSARASESPFAEGLEEREFVPPLMGPGRWTSGGATFRFRHLPEGPAKLEVRVRNHQNAVRVLAEGATLGLLAESDRGADFDVTVRRPDFRVDLVVKPFLARAGRRLGTFLDRVTLVPARTLLPPVALLGLFALPALAASLGGLFSGLGPSGSVGVAAATSTVQSLLLLPHGVLRSGYADELALLLAFGLALAALAARRRPALFVALLAAFLVQGAAALSPLVIGLDASFHGHNLSEVRAGDYFLESETQHKPPFRFPYGVSFYLPLVPFARAGLDLVTTVRAGASLAGVLLSAAVFWLVARGTGRPAVGAAAVVLLQLVPWSFDVYSNGNYSNVFAQMAVVCFVAWWATGKPLGWPAGAAIFVLGALAHLSGTFFLAALAAGLLFVNRRDLAAERSGFVALGVGAAVTALYYAHFWPLVAEQLPRLAEGGRGGTGEESVLASLVAQLGGALYGWGAPIIFLALAGRPRGDGSLDRALRAVWIAGGLLALAAVATPLEVRYLYALSFPLAVAGASGLARLLEGGLAPKLVAAALVTLQLGLGAWNVAQALLYDWRV